MNFGNGPIPGQDIVPGSGMYVRRYICGGIRLMIFIP